MIEDTHLPTASRLIEIRDMSVAFNGLAAVRNVSLAVDKGESLGIVGESGSGKSVTWLAALGLLPAHARIDGSVLLKGEDILHAPAAKLERLRGNHIALIFQDPTSSLNPVHTVGEQVAEVVRTHRGADRRSARAEARRLFDQVGIPDAGNRLNAYPHELSGGQNQRVMIAMALAGQPDLLVADEPTTALDVTIQAQILDLLTQVQRDTGMALVVISHDLGVISETCARVAVMYAGKIVEEAPAAMLFASPSHPYTRGLLGSMPPISGLQGRLTAIPGTVPDPTERPKGCAFATRCPQKTDLCTQTAPQSVTVDRDGKQIAACHHIDHPSTGDVRRERELTVA